MVHHMDVKTAFLNGNLEEEIYMQIPEGITVGKNIVCKLKKALYGLKQAARCWFKEFDTVIRAMGFKESGKDRCIYVLEGESIQDSVYIVQYVDDLVISTGNMTKMTPN